MRYRISPLLYGALTLLMLQPVSTLRAQASGKEFQQPNAYAVVIGISQYREEVIPKVAYAAKDAEAVARLLEVQGGIPKTHIKLLTESKATYTDIRNHVNDWLRMRVKPDSTVYIYYAGHGAPNPQTGEVYLVPWEGNPDFPSGLYPVKDLYAGLNKLPAKEIIVMLDSCFSGAPGRSVLPKGTRPMVITLENPLLAGGKIAVLSASTGNQMSNDYDKTGHGLFTHYLLEGLGGAADKDKNHLVTLRELYPYVREQVSETAVEELNREQTPTLLPGEDVLGARTGQTLVQVMPGFSPSITAKTEEPKPIQEARARPYEAPRQPIKEIMGSDGASMVLIPEGDFLYGEEKRRLPLEAFYIDKFEVSNSLYSAFMQKTGRNEPSYLSSTQRSDIGTLPVYAVDMKEADAYCRYYGKRLPTEEEWEKAARGTDGRMYPWGNSRNSSYANYGKDDSGQYALVMPIGSFEEGKSPYGVYDMAGNVAEWTSSQFAGKPHGIIVVRGGSWKTPSQQVRTTSREDYGPLAQNGWVGFRCAQDAE
jgi:formylglycine-generating enzyme required for sulfatase activity